MAKKRSQSRKKATEWLTLSRIKMGAALIVAVLLGVAVGWHLGPNHEGKSSQQIALKQQPALTPVPVPPTPSQLRPSVNEQTSISPSVAPLTQTAFAPPPGQGGQSGLPAWRRFAVPPPRTEGQSQIALVIDDMGVDRKRSARALRLPAPVTMAYLPYAQDVQDQTQEAHRLGHELLVHLPMEAMDKNADPGPNALFTTLKQDEILNRLRANLDRFTGYVGINNHMGSRFTSFEPGMEAVIAELKARGLLFLDSRTSADSVGYKIARRVGMPTAYRDVFLDHVEGAANVAQQLRVLEDVARRHGMAIAIGHPHDSTLDELERWIPTLQTKGLQLIPLSAMIIRQQQG